MKLKQLVLTAIGLFSYSTTFSQIDFQIHEISSSLLSVLEPQAVFAADLDGDGDMDALSASQGDDKIAWFENIDGLGTFGPLKLISDDIPGARAVSAADLDGDGDNDVLSTSYFSDFVAWHENIGGASGFGPPQIIGNNLNQARKVFPIDIDGDMKLDVVTVSSSGLDWFKNVDGQGDFGGANQIDNSGDNVSSAYPLDIDGDGDIDILCASGINTNIFWYENLDGLGSFGASQQITSEGSNQMELSASDLDNDGDMDIITGSPNSQVLAWYENVDGSGTFGAQQVIDTNLSYIRDLFSEDADGDGDMDIFMASANPGGSLSWFENTDGQGNFNSEVIISNSQVQLRSVFVTDLNGNGSMDVMAASENDQKIAWYKNTGLGTFGSEQSILSDQVTAPSVARSVDLDGDGDLDVIVSSDEPRKIGWYENLDGQGTFGNHTVIASATNFNSNISYSTADVDGDGDLDIVTANRDFDEVAWYENEDGLANFGSKNVISAGVHGFSSVSTADIDGDGDMDAVAVAWLDHKIAWFENTDGLGNFGSIQLIPITLFLPGFPTLADIDGDGDIDIFNNISNDNLNVWYENTDGLGTFSSENYMTSESADVGATILADLDDDDDLDILATAIFDNKLVWYEHTDGLGTFGPEETITNITTPGGIQFNDLDGDGDKDILIATANYNNGANNINWMENTDGLGTFGPIEEISDEVDGPGSLTVDDIDGDGDMDILLISREDNKILWFENLAIDVSTDEIFINNSQLLVYPNPAINLVEVQFTGENLASVSLYSLEGKKIRTSLSSTIDVSGLSDGMYIVGVITGSGKRAFKKLVKSEK